MHFAVIDTESLQDPTIINEFDHFRVIVEYEPNSEANKYHHIFFVKIPASDVDKKIKQIAKEMKDGWFAFSWDETRLKIVFNQKTFFVSLINPDYSAAQNYGHSIGIQAEFLDYKKYFDRYRKIALKFDDSNHRTF